VSGGEGGERGCDMEWVQEEGLKFFLGDGHNEKGEEGLRGRRVGFENHLSK